MVIELLASAFIGILIGFYIGWAAGMKRAEYLVMDDEDMRQRIVMMGDLFSGK